MATARTPYRFFLEQAGYSYDPKTERPIDGKRRCARELSKAERHSLDNGWYVEWWQDENGCSGCDCGAVDCRCSNGDEHETLGCVLKDEDGDVLASLWGICEPSREYRRVVAAELALESMPTA